MRGTSVGVATASSIGTMLFAEGCQGDSRRQLARFVACLHLFIGQAGVINRARLDGARDKRGRKLFAEGCQGDSRQLARFAACLHSSSVKRAS